MPPKKKPSPKREFHVGDHMHAGKIVDAVVKAIIPQANGLRLQVDFEENRTALIREWQIVND